MATDNTTIGTRDVSTDDCDHPEDARLTISRRGPSAAIVECTKCGRRWDTDTGEIVGEPTDAIERCIAKLEYIDGMVTNNTTKYDAGFTTTVSTWEMDVHSHPIEDCGATVKMIRAPIAGNTLIVYVDIN